MNYHKARERSDKSGWAWTTMNDGRVWTSGGCITWPDGEPTVEQSLAGTGPLPGEPHAHATSEEADRCFYEFEAGRLREHEMLDTQHRCEFPGCSAWTSKTLAARLLGEADLCDEHRTPDGWRAVHPFHPNLSITASW